MPANGSRAPERALQVNDPDKAPGTATLAAYPTLVRKGPYDLYSFERKVDGRWSFDRSDMKVFANE